MRTPFVAALALILMAYGSGWPQSELRHVDVFTSGQDGYHTFRIPAIEAAPDGSLLAFAEARKYNRSDPGMKENDIDLVMKRSTDGGATWSAMKVIEDPGEKWSAANPSTVVDKTNRKVWVFYIRSKPGRSSETSRPGTDDMQNMARTSSDNGITWSEAIDLTSAARDMSDSNWRVSVPGPGGAIQDRKGRLLVPLWKVEPYGVFALFSEDHGRTWHRGQQIPGGRGGDENQLVELSDGSILMDFRQNTGTHRWMAVSNDGGKTWSEPREGLTVTPVACSIERFMIRPSGRDRNRILWTGPKGPERLNLVIRVSRDDAKTFPVEKPVYQGYSAYSELTVLRDGAAGILWERGVKQAYEFISFTRVTAAFLEPAQ